VIDMIRSPAYRALSLSGHKILSRLEIELAEHGGDKGRENGNLIVTYSNFEAYGMDRHAIGPAISEVVALGFVEVTEAGCAGNESFRRPNKFRLTYRHANGQNPTDDWEAVPTIEGAEAIASNARGQTRKNRSPVGVNATSKCGKPPPSEPIPSGENPHYCHSGKTPTTFDISGLSPGSRSALPKSAVASEPGKTSEPAKIPAIEMIMKTQGCSFQEASELFEELPARALEPADD
jgi:hypothetical protein